MLSSSELMLKRALEEELFHINLMLSNSIKLSSSPEILKIVKQYVESRIQALS